MNMSDNKKEVGQRDRVRVNLSEDYEVQTFVEAIKKQRPGASSEAIRAALIQAGRDSGSSLREVLTEKVLQILGSK
jgi:hypothetical protein